MAVFDYNICKLDCSPDPEERDLCVAPVEVKTAIGRDFGARGTSVESADQLICDIDTDTFKQRVPGKHIAQLVHYCISCNMTWVFYVHTSESQILYVVMARCNRALVSLVDSYYTEKISPSFKWVHTETPTTQLLIGIHETDRVISEALTFWRMFSKVITEPSPFVPVHIF